MGMPFFPRSLKSHFLMIFFNCFAAPLFSFNFFGWDFYLPGSKPLDSADSYITVMLAVLFCNNHMPLTSTGFDLLLSFELSICSKQ